MTPIHLKMGAEPAPETLCLSLFIKYTSGSGHCPTEYSCNGICVPSRGLSFFGTGSDPHLQSREVVKAQWYHSWSVIAVPKESDELVHCYGEVVKCPYSQKWGCWFISSFQKSLTSARLWFWWLCWSVIFSSVDDLLNMDSGVITSCHWPLLLQVIRQ
jgi:hypothetical protein